VTDLNTALGQYQSALDMAAAGDFAGAQPLAADAEARILQLCTSNGYADIASCVGQPLPPLPQPDVAEPAPAQPAPEQPAPSAADPSVDPAAQLQAAVQLYGQGIGQLQAGDATGQQAIDQGLAQIFAICDVSEIGAVDPCLAQYGLVLPQFQSQAPATEPPVVSEAPVEAPPPAEPVAEVLLDQPVTSEAVEPLPDNVAPSEVAPLLDSIKDALIGGEAQTPAPDTAAPPPTSDADAQVLLAPGTPLPPESGTQIAPPIELLIPSTTQPGVEITPQANGTGFVFQFNTELFFFNPDQERDRVWDETEDEIFYEELSRGRIKETIVRPNGVQIVTIRGRDGEILRRSRIMPDGREYILAYYDDEEEEGEFTEYVDPGEELPPLVLNIPARDYILDARDADEEEVADFFSQPPVEQVRRLYSIEEVKRSSRIRDTVRRLEIGGLTFDSGKATISRSQVGALSNVANAMLELLDRNPAETFLIEGHTDAVGSEILNLGLSDLRASTIARILTDFYGIPPENLVTQGYGERYLKVRTELAERLNRRVQVRRITPLITMASN
jgi:outer membrane protein OmpA-like peptidoglycan-associated protein